MNNDLKCLNDFSDNKFAQQIGICLDLSLCHKSVAGQIIHQRTIKICSDVSFSKKSFVMLVPDVVGMLPETFFDVVDAILGDVEQEAHFCRF